MDETSNKSEDNCSESLFSPEDAEDNSDESWVPSVENDDTSLSEDLKHPLKIAVEPGKKTELSDTSENKRATNKEGQFDETRPGGQSERRKISCPISTCKAKVIHLPRHMRNVHNWTKEAASKVLSKFNMRQCKDKLKNEKKEAKNKDYHSRRRCPLPNCHSIVQRLPAHLQKVHKLDKQSKEYCDALENGTIAPDSKHPTIPLQEERISTKQWVGGCESQTVASNENKVCNEGEKEDIGLPMGFDTGSDSGDDSDDDEFTDRENETPSAEGMPALIVNFEDWLLSPDGGNRDKKTAKQHSAQLFALLKAIDNQEDLKSLLDLMLIRHVFLKNYVRDKNYEAGTIKSYLMSLRHFYSFILSDRPGNLKYNVDEVASAREKVKMWSVSYKREASTRKWQKLEEDTMNHLTPGNIRSFEKSETARDAIKIIGEHSDTTRTTAVTQQSYTLVRNFLFTQIFIENANRPGVLAGMTIQEYRKMTKQDEYYIITVMKHKTAYVHGPARIVLNSRLRSWLSVFVDIMRPQIASATCGNVFLSWNGKEMDSGHITRAVQSVFKKGGMDVKVTSTSFRKAAVTAVHSGNPALSGKLARHMSHSESTAKKYYLLAEKRKESVEASKNLGVLMRCDGEEKNEGNDEKDEGVSGSKVQVENDRPGKDTEDTGNKRIPWNEEDSQKVKAIFEDEIVAKKITMDRVRVAIETSKELHGMSPRRVYDKVKMIMNQGSSVSEPVPELPQVCDSLEDKVSRFGHSDTNTDKPDEEQSTSVLAPSERSNIFTNDEMKYIHKLFRDMIVENKRICRIEIQKRCTADKEGQKLLNKLSVSQILNRIKYERRKHRLPQ